VTEGTVMFRRLACVFLALISCLALDRALAQNPSSSKQQPAPKQATEKFWQKLLRISGIAESPTTLKGEGDEVESGQILLAEVGTGKTRSITDSAGYRSPVFVPGASEILALKGTEVVRLPAGGGQPKGLYKIPGISKIVGFSRDDPDQALILAEDAEGHLAVGLLSMSNGKVTPIPYDPASSDDRHMIEHLRSWDRWYGDKGVFVQSQSKAGMAGKIEWTDVFLKVGTGAPVDVSKCEGVNCGQPSLSSDGQFVVFVKVEP
jgi:hypothetical protein